MATIEERLQALEQEHTELKQEHTDLKKTIELQTIAIGALVNEATLERLQAEHTTLLQQILKRLPEK